MTESAIERVRTDRGREPPPPARSLLPLSSTASSPQCPGVPPRTHRVRPVLHCPRQSDVQSSHSPPSFLYPPSQAHEKKTSSLPPSCSTCPSQLDTVIRSQLSCTAYTVVASVLVVRTVGAPLKKTGISSSSSLYFILPLLATPRNETLSLSQASLSLELQAEVVRRSPLVAQPPKPPPGAGGGLLLNLTRLVLATYVAIPRHNKWKKEERRQR